MRGFGSWFFQRKRELLAFEIERSGEHPALWEKKGASLYTVTNVTRYPELRKFTNRLFNKIERLGGYVFYVGVRKTAAPGAHNPGRCTKRFFCDDGEPFHVEDKTYVLSKQWGLNALDAAEKLTDMFPDLNIEYKPADTDVA